jgi:hypothetical protein
MFHSNQIKILNAIDESIEKWKKIVYDKDYYNETINCPLCRLYENCVNQNYYDLLIRCPIYLYTGYSNCKNTPFYDTIIWKNHHYKFIKAIETKETEPYNNLMLSCLYDIRRRYISDVYYVKEQLKWKIKIIEN